MSIKLTPRLMTAVPYVRRGGLVADVGTDHAYLPIYLCEAGILSPVPTPEGSSLCAIAADINRGPVERADRHIAETGLTARIRTVQTDGLRGLEIYAPSDIIIFGMGGELIAAILEASPWVGKDGRRLILQPMTHAEKLRTYLLSAGFAIVGETLSREGDRIYQTLCAEPGAGAAPAVLTPGELAVGQAVWHKDAARRALYAALIEKTLRIETAARDARRRAGRRTPEADLLIASLMALQAELR